MVVLQVVAAQIPARRHGGDGAPASVPGGSGRGSWQELSRQTLPATHPALVPGVHEDRQARSAHSNPLHEVVLPDPVHIPVPLQVRLTTPVRSSLHTLPQSVPAAACRHPPDPSHRPIVPQAFIVVSSVQLSASGIPSGTGAHVPAALPQLWQVGQLGVVQQVLSTQFPLAHSASVAQRDPTTLFPQLPVAVSQTRPLQSSLLVQVVRHMLLLPSQR